MAEADLDQLRASVEDARAAVARRREQLAARDGAASALSELREQVGAAERRNARLEAAAAAALRQAEELRGGAQAADEQLERTCHDAKLAAAARYSSARAQQARLAPRDPASAPEAVLMEYHSAAVEREKEITVVHKQTRELEHILQMKRVRQAELEVEAQKQIDDVACERDAHIHGLVRRCLTERETVLSDIRETIKRCTDAQERMRNGYIEDQAAKGKVVEDFHQKVEAGLVLKEGQEKRGPEQAPLKEIKVRCAKARTEQDDHHTAYMQRYRAQLTTYSDVTQQVEDARKTFKHGKVIIQDRIRKTKELQERIAREKAELERELMQLGERVAVEKSKQEHYEADNQRVFLSMVHQEKKLDDLMSDIERQKQIDAQGMAHLQTLRDSARPQIADRPGRLAPGAGGGRRASRAGGGSRSPPPAGSRAGGA
eukprot:TRINITY_DN8503_c0_g1_i1.p1 TRINITY_DN8503_c0_g1~~TRINITY_DN8503_c0_g1_i1.p1  ORF type:complete len:431 (+),score=162.72 TRINITY_DN8503_c0_g1_i1:81-1373(+)